MKKELRIFFTALMFYTRLPCPKWVDHDEEYINRSIRYFPLIGWIVGAIAAVAYYLGFITVSPAFGVVLFFSASVLVTGAFHEDGFADVCDGFGGGWTKERILDIMKDSRIGAYGVVGLILLYLLKGTLLLETVNRLTIYHLLLLMIAIHALSRFMAATFVFTHEYVRDADTSKVKPVAKKIFKEDLLVSAVWGFIPLVVLSVWLEKYTLLLMIPATYLVKMRLARYFKKWIGGYTGDCLGATQQVAEASAYFFFLLIWKFI